MPGAIRILQLIERRGIRLAFLIAAGLTAAALFCVRFLLPDTDTRDPAATTRQRAWTDVRDIAFGLRAHYAEHEKFPAGSEASIAAALKGDNPTSTIYVFEIPRDSTGAFTDPWGTPYRIDLTAPDGPRVHSCGPDKADAAGAPGSDDIVSWRH